MQANHNKTSIAFYALLSSDYVLWCMCSPQDLALHSNFKFKDQVAKSQKVEAQKTEPSRLQTKLSERHKQLAEVADATFRLQA